MKFKHMRWEEICKRLPKDRDIIGAEIGVWTGKTSNYLLEHLPNLKMLWMIDAWDDPKNNPSFLHSGAKMARYGKEVYDQAFEQANQVHLKYPDRSCIMKLSSVEASWRFNGETLDFVFFDSDHSENGLNSDFDCWLNKIKKNGLICGHDLNPNPQKGFKGVYKAVYERFSKDEIELGDDHTYFIIKK
jgi:hypothetical protein